MVEELGPVVGVGGGAEDVHHHEVLDVVLFPPRLLQLVDIIPAITCIEYDHLEEPDTLADLQILSIFLIMGMFTSSSFSLLGLRLEVESGLSPDRVASLETLFGSESSGSRCKCPNHFNLLCCIVIVHGTELHLLYRLVFFILFVLSICLKKFL